MINLIEYRIMDRLYVMMKEYVQDKNYLYIFYLHTMEYPSSIHLCKMYYT